VIAGQGGQGGRVGGGRLDLPALRVQDAAVVAGAVVEQVARAD
jgi:hypothetical protein